MRQRRTLVLRPAPIGASIERIGKSTNFRLFGAIPIEIRGSREHAAQQKGTVHR
jgi:hypothetical protein